MKKTIIFDFNGTLLDDVDLCLKILNMLCESHHLPKVSMEKYKEVFTFPVSNYYEQLGFKVDDESLKNLSQEFHSYYNKMSYKECHLYKNVTFVLEKLSKNYTLVCLSASLKSTLLKQLEFYNIQKYFTYIIGLDDTYAKSKIQVALDFIKNTQIDVFQTILVGDSLHDEEVAKAINVQPILISTGHTSKNRLMSAKCKIIDDLIELL